jgi:hypothetical protein
MIHAETLALKFAARVRENLSVAEIAQANELNRRETQPGVCHTHDFIDANELMMEAVLDCGMDYDFLEQHAGVVDEAWQIAREGGFWINPADEAEAWALKNTNY